MNGFITIRKDGTAHCVSVSPSDFEKVMLSGPWFIVKRKKTFYVSNRSKQLDGSRLTETLHRFILGLTPGNKLEADHIDGNGLNNRRDNLRVVTRSEQSQNRSKDQREYKAKRSSKFRGVSWRESSGKWRAAVNKNGKRTYLGLFASEQDAASAAEKCRKLIYTHSNESRHPVLEETV